MDRKCPYCNSDNVVKRGFRYNQKGKTQMMKCNKCERKFTPGRFKRMRYRKNIILKTLKLYAEGYTCREVSQILKNQDIDVSRTTVINWKNKFSKIYSTFQKENR